MYAGLLYIHVVPTETWLPYGEDQLLPSAFIDTVHVTTIY